MRKRGLKFSFSAFLATMVASLILAGMVAGAYGLGAGIVAFVVLMGTALCSPWLPFLKKCEGITVNGIQKEIWTNYIDENLYKDNSFLTESMDHSEYVDNLTVHSPQAGDDGNVVENRNVFPATVTTRTDTTVDWYINEYTVDPWKISNAEEVELSYNKLESMLYSRRAILDQKIADGSLYSFSPTGTAQLRNEAGTNNNILRSSGVPNNDLTAQKIYSAAYTPGGTGFRMCYGLYDVRQLKLLFDLQNIPANDRHIICSANALDQIISDIIATKYRDSISQFNTTSGTVEKLMGFTFHTRASVVTYTNDILPVAKAVGAATAATDNDAILAWHKASLRRAAGETKVYDDADRPEYYGKLFSILKRFGMTIGRNDQLGVAAMVQAAYVPGGN